MFYIDIWNGLLEGKHWKKMGVSVWIFMWCIDKVTMVDEDGYGYVLGGKPVQLDDIGIGSRPTISRNLARLEKEGYISLTYASKGIVIKIAKARRRFIKNEIKNDKRFIKVDTPHSYSRHSKDKDTTSSNIASLSDNKKTFSAREYIVELSNSNQDHICFFCNRLLQCVFNFIGL